jgi:3-hydroxyacyl-[acyl-carrier-protein] dehydratase
MSDSLKNSLHQLPHGPEFRFVDRLTELVPGRSGTGEYCVRGDEPFLRGHFPGDPMFPGVLLLEAAAQLAGVIAQADPALSPVPNLKLTAIRMVKILGTASPGQVIRLRAEVTRRLGHLIQAQIQGWVSETLILQGEITLSGSPP